MGEQMTGRRKTTWIRLAAPLLAVGILCMGSSRSSFGQSPAPATRHYPDGFSCPPAGITVQTSDGFTIKFQGADPHDPEICVWDSIRLNKKAPGRFLYALHNVNDHSVHFDQIRDAYRQFFPLAVGKTVQKLVTGEKFGSTERLTLTVERVDTMNIGATIRHAWVIHEQGLGSFGNDTHMDNYYWLEVGSFVLLRLSEDVDGKKYYFDVIDELSTPPSPG